MATGEKKSTASADMITQKIADAMKGIKAAEDALAAAKNALTAALAAIPPGGSQDVTGGG